MHPCTFQFNSLLPAIQDFRGWGMLAISAWPCSTAMNPMELMRMSVSPSLVTPDRDPAERAPRRVRHEPRRRELEVKHVDKIAAHMTRVTLAVTSRALPASVSTITSNYSFPQPRPAPGAEPQALARDYTPRRYDPTRNILEIDFAIYDAGPATRWAETVRPGDPLTIGGPRGSFIIPTNFDWHLLMGDETAIPAMEAAWPSCRRAPHGGACRGRWS